MKVLLIGDGIALTTGFAQVLRRLAAALVGRGDDVWQIAALDTPPLCDSRGYYDLGVTPRFPTSGSSDPIGLSILADTLRECQPDVILINCDAGSAWQWLEQLRDTTLPTVLYAPIEGAPVHPLLAQSFRRATRAITYTAWAAENLAREHHLAIPYVYHGVDTDRFHPLRTAVRTRVRRELGWEGLFVTAYVARNNGRKGHDRLLKALVGLPPHHRLYLHCLPFDNWNLQGWDLGWLAEYWHVHRRVEFSPQTRAELGVSAYSLAERLGAADCYVSPSRVEGFGLPLLEAMACGLPVLAPADGGNQQEVLGAAAYEYLPVRDWDTWHTCAQLASVYPGHIAQAIAHIEAHPAAAASAGCRGRARVAEPAFAWQTMVDTILPLVDEAVADGSRT